MTATTSMKNLAIVLLSLKLHAEAQKIDGKPTA